MTNWSNNSQHSPMEPFFVQLPAFCGFCYIKGIYHRRIVLLFPQRAFRFKVSMRRRRDANHVLLQISYLISFEVSTNFNIQTYCREFLFFFCGILFRLTTAKLNGKFNGEYNHCIFEKLTRIIIRTVLNKKIEKKKLVACEWIVWDLWLRTYFFFVTV